MCLSVCRCRYFFGESLLPIVTKLSFSETAPLRFVFFIFFFLHPDKAVHSHDTAYRGEGRAALLCRVAYWHTLISVEPLVLEGSLGLPLRHAFS